MEQIWKWLKIQPWWIKLVIGLAAVVAMVWGTTSCTGQLYLEKRGFHQDSIYQWMKINPRKTTGI